MTEPLRALVTGAARPGAIGNAIVANAGLPTIFGAAHTLPLERWRQDIEVNLTGSFRVVQACLAGMRGRGRRGLPRLADGRQHHRPRARDRRWPDAEPLSATRSVIRQDSVP